MQIKITVKYSHQNGYYQKKKRLLSKREYKTNVGEDMVSKEPCAPFVECRLFQPLYMEFPQKFENRIYTCQQTQF